MSGSDNLDEFVQQVNASQRLLYTLILTLLPRREDAYDILQETNVVIWQKREEFVRGTNFHAWVSQIARNKVLAHRRKMRRDRLCFDDRLIGKLSADVADTPLFGEEWLKALWRCTERLTNEDRVLLEKRYVEGLQSRYIADQMGRSPAAIAQALYRIRLALMRCIDEAISSKGKN
jgi:RNA polymerase sigma-70 factor, ECF subfamily